MFKIRASSSIFEIGIWLSGLEFWQNVSAANRSHKLICSFLTFVFIVHAFADIQMASLLVNLEYQYLVYSYWKNVACSNIVRLFCEFLGITDTSCMYLLGTMIANYWKKLTHDYVMSIRTGRIKMCIYFTFLHSTRMRSAVARSCHAHTRSTRSVPSQWYRTACKYTSKVSLIPKPKYFVNQLHIAPILLTQVLRMKIQIVSILWNCVACYSYRL